MAASQSNKASRTLAPSLNDYDVERVVGRGTTGSILFYAIDNVTHRRVVLKNVLCSDKVAFEQAVNEAERLQRAEMCHPFILRRGFASFKHTHPDGTTSFYLVLDLAERASGMSRLVEDSPRDGSNIDTLFVYTFQLLLALDFMHHSRRIHRNLKPQNIVIDKDGNLQLCDFGITLLNEDYYNVESYMYMSPEMLAAMRAHVSLAGGSAAGVCNDVYAFGGTVYARLMGHGPGKHPGATAADFPALPRWVPAELAAMIRSCLAFDPKMRPSTTYMLHIPLLFNAFCSFLSTKLARAHLRMTDEDFTRAVCKSFATRYGDSIGGSAERFTHWHLRMCSKTLEDQLKRLGLTKGLLRIGTVILGSDIVKLRWLSVARRPSSLHARKRQKALRDVPLCCSRPQTT